MVQKIYISIIFFFAVINIHAQSVSIQDLGKKEQKAFKKATELFQKKKFEKSQEKLLGLLDDYPKVIELHALLAKSYLENGQLQGAIPHLIFICEEAPSLQAKACYTLYKFYAHNNDYKEALKYLERYDAALSISDQMKDKVANQMKFTRFRDSLVRNPVSIAAERLPKKINTEHLEYLPAMTADGETLIFTRRIARQEDFYEATYDNKDSLVSVDAINELNTVFDEGAHCISPNGQLLIFTSCGRRDSKGSCDLYYCVKKSDGWSIPKNLGSRINSEYWEAQPSLSPDGKTLYFSSTRVGGYGKKDIWKSQLKDRKWSDPINLGSAINTSGNEASPFIHFDNRTLYFRSDSHLGMGGYDIFLSSKVEDNWTKPKNLGYPINTENDEGALSVSLDGTFAYFASDQGQESVKKHLDILRFELPESIRPKPVSYVKVRSLDNDTNDPVQSRLVVINLSTGDTLSNQKANKNGSILIVVNPDTKYMLHVEAEDYVFYSEHILFDSSTVTKPIVKDIYLSPIKTEIGEQARQNSVVLNNIFFEQGSAVLLNESVFEIQKLYDLLSENPSVTISIIGHTDNVGSTEDNNKLSLERALSVKNAIIALGINKSRIDAIGKGETEPIADNNTDAGRQKNRRTEFLIN